MSNSGFIKLYRSIIHTDIFDNPDTLKIWIYCLCKANHKDKEWKGRTIKRGSFISSYRKIAKECNMSVQTIRTHIATLEATQNLTHYSTHENTTFYIVDFEKYNTPSNTRSNTKGNTKPNNNEEERRKNNNSASHSSSSSKVGAYEDTDFLPRL